MFNKFIILPLLGVFSVTYSNVPNCGSHCPAQSKAKNSDGTCPTVHCKCDARGKRKTCDVEYTDKTTCYYDTPLICLNEG